MLIFPALVALPNLSRMVQVTMAMPHASIVTVAMPPKAVVTLAMPPAALVLALLGLSQEGTLVAAALPALSHGEGPVVLPALSRVRLEFSHVICRP